MQILGIRTSTAAVRYAILEWDGQSAKLLNAEGENKLEFPADKTTTPQRLDGLFQEFKRILRKNPCIARIMVKVSEYVGKEKTSTREAAYLDAIVLMIAEQKSLPVEILLYRSMATKREEVKSFAETNVGRTVHHWDERMADAIVAAWTGRNHRD